MYYLPGLMTGTQTAFIRDHIMGWVLGLASLHPPHGQRGDPLTYTWPSTLGGPGVGRSPTPPSAKPIMIVDHHSTSRETKEEKNH